MNNPERIEDVSGENSSAEQRWGRLVDEKIREAEAKKVPARFVNTVRENTDDGYYITIDKRRSPYTIIFFHAHLNLKDGTGKHQAIILEEGQPIKQLIQSKPSKDDTDISWFLAPEDDPSKGLIFDSFGLLREARLFEPHLESWKGQYPNVDRVIEALNK